VTPGQVIDVDSMSVEGDTVELERVYLVADGDNVSVGKPTVEGAKVIADIVDEGKGKKILVFKYKPKVRYRRKKGHRQPYTRLAIKEIVAG
jgi:large subunit ribosomal protein L21